MPCHVNIIYILASFSVTHSRDVVIMKSVAESLS